MRLFSSRRQSITADLRERAAQFTQRYGRASSQREMAQLAQASNFKTRAAKHATLDVAQLHAGWADKLARTLGVPLASVAPSVWHNGGNAGPRQRGPDAAGPVLSQLELSRAAQKAVGLAQQEKSTWTRADVIKYLGRVLPRTGLEPDAAAALLEDLADQALYSDSEPVICLEAPQAVEVRRRPQPLPAARRRALRHPRAAGDGRTPARAGPRRRCAAPGPRGPAARTTSAPRPGCGRIRPRRRCRC